MLIQVSIIDGKFVMSPNGFPKADIYVQPDETELKHLLDDLKIDAYTLHSALDPNETPRLEFEDDYVAVLMKCPERVAGENNVLFKINTSGQFFFHSGQIVAVQNSLPPTRRLPGGRDGARADGLKTSQDIMLRWISQIIRIFEINLRAITDRRDQLKKEMIRMPKNENLMSIFTLREGLVYYIEALRGNGYLFERLRTAAGKIGFSKENLELLEDLAIENQQFLEQAQINARVLTELSDTWTTVINNNLSGIMKNMNSLVIAISIPSFFTGVGGMSEFTALVSPYLAWYVAYPLFFVFMATVSILIYHLIQHFYRI